MVKTKMAAHRERREIKAPKRLIDEFRHPEELESKKRRLKPRLDNSLYEIEVKDVDREGKRLKIHYKRFSDQFDEWKPYDDNNFPVVRLEHEFKPSEVSVEDRLHIFQDRLYREVKRKLYSGRKDDPEIRIEIPVEVDVFEMSIANAARARQERNKQVYRITVNSHLDNYLGIKWDERILNENGDYAYVVEGTLRFWLMEKNNIIEYKLIGGKYVRSEIEDGHQLVFRFVRGDGNRRQYMTRSL